jgi:hypothetical protein
MSGRIAPTAGEVITGIFLALFGIALLLTGGACTALWIGGLASARSGAIAGTLAMLAISVGTIVVGLLSLKGAVSCFRGKAPPEP